jgi:hypothetical protein
MDFFVLTLTTFTNHESRVTLLMGGGFDSSYSSEPDVF